jgi:hypothetical protein
MFPMKKKKKKKWISDREWVSTRERHVKPITHSLARILIDIPISIIDVDSIVNPMDNIYLLNQCYLYYGVLILCNGIAYGMIEFI